MDFGKYQYQEQKRAREAKKHQKIIEVKEIKFRPKVDEHDYQFKKKHIERFLADGDKVKATVFFRGREMAHPEIGRRILERLIGELSEVALAESGPRQEGNQMHTILTGKSDKSGRRPAAAPAADAARRPAPSTTAAAPRRWARRPWPARWQHRRHPKKARRCRSSRHIAAPPSASRRPPTGKFLRSSAFKRHILTSKTTKVKRAPARRQAGLRATR